MNRGFTLLESVMYLACSVLLISVLVTGFSLLYKKSREQLVLANRFFDVIMATDYLTKDIQQSTIVSTNPTLIVDKQGIVVTWLVRNRNLLRIQQGSHGKSTSLVARHVKSFSVTPYISRGSIKGLTIKLHVFDVPERLQLTMFVATRQALS